MDIRDWPMDQIMQLPDCCFGRRWPIGVSVFGDEVTTYYDISELALPERCVIWKLNLSCPMYSTAIIYTSLALGDQLPVADAQFDAMEPLFRDIGALLAGRRVVNFNRMGGAIDVSMRMPVATNGRRLVGRFEWLAAAAAQVVVVLTVSSIPTEVPDCLLSAHP
ncbi:hypothetical protein ES703_18305 [subsurface metagenome]